MADYRSVELDFEPYEGPDPRINSTGGFVYEDKFTPIAWPPEKKEKIREGRQAYFEQQLERLSGKLQCRCLPVYISWRSGNKNQMDKGCIGHSFGPNSLITSVAIDSDNNITHVILRDQQC